MKNARNIVFLSLQWNIKICAFRPANHSLPPELLFQQRESETCHRHIFHGPNPQSRHVRPIKSHNFASKGLQRCLVPKKKSWHLKGNNLFFFVNYSVFAVLPKTTPDGYRVIYCKVLDSEPSRYIQTMELRIFDMVCQLWAHENGTENGQIIIMDMDGIVLGHVGRLSLMTTKVYLHYLQVGVIIKKKNCFGQILCF